MNLPLHRCVAAFATLPTFLITVSGLVHAHELELSEPTLSGMIDAGHLEDGAGSGLEALVPLGPLFALQIDASGPYQVTASADTVGWPSGVVLHLEVDGGTTLVTLGATPVVIAAGEDPSPPPRVLDLRCFVGGLTVAVVPDAYAAAVHFAVSDP